MSDLITPDGYTEIFSVTDGNSVMEIFVSLEVVNNKIKISALRTYFQDTLPALIASNTANIIPNTTHRGSDGKDHSDVVLNNTHRGSDGTNHADVVANTAAIVPNTTHRGSDGKDHSDVVLNNTHRGSDGSDHTFIDQDVSIESGPTFKDGKKLLTSANYLHVAAATHNDVFDKLAPFIPDNGNIMKLTGFIVDFSVSRAERITSTTITFYGVRASGLFTSTVTDGDTGSTYSAISIAW